MHMGTYLALEKRTGLTFPVLGILTIWFERNFSVFFTLQFSYLTRKENSLRLKSLLQDVLAKMDIISII